MLKIFYKQANLVQISATNCVKHSLSCFKSTLSKARCSRQARTILEAQYKKSFSKLLLTSPSTQNYSG